MPWPRFFRRTARVSPDAVLPRRVGLVLGGGAVRGAAHLGVLSVFEREGFRPDLIVGTSIGSIIGAGIAAGHSSTEMWEVFRRLDWRHVARPAWRSKLSMLESDPLGELITRVTDVERIEDLDRPFAAVACDLLTGSRVILRSGDLTTALAGSCAIPAAFEPVRHQGALLVDGGVVDNLPVDVALEMGADYVVAIDIMPALDGSHEPRDLRDVVLMAWNIVEHNTEGGRERAHLVVTPDVARVHLSDFREAPVAYEAGIAAAESVLDRLRSDLGLGAPTA